MRVAAGLLLSGTILLACRPPHQTAPSAPRPTARVTHPTQFRAGEVVAYGFTGKAVPRPVMLREEIVGESPEGITLDVVIEREQQRADAEDRQHFQKTVNARTVDLYRFMTWNLLVGPEHPSVEKKTTEEMDIGGQRLRCEVTNGSAKLRGRKIRFVTSECPGFLWTYGPARYWDEETNDTLLSIEIVETKRETLCDYDKPACPAGRTCAFVERGRAACVESAIATEPFGTPFQATRGFACTQRARSEAGRSHSFTGDLFAVDLASARDEKSVEVLAPIAGEAFVFDGCEAERNDAPDAKNDSRCGLGYGNHVKIWDGTNLVLLAHLARATAKNGPVKRGDAVGIEGVSGAAGQRHVHVTVTRPRPADDVRKILTTPGWKGSIPVRWRLDVTPAAAWVDELSCDESRVRTYTGR